MKKQYLITLFIFFSHFINTVSAQIKLAAGSDASFIVGSCAIASMGHNSHGQLGDSTQAMTFVPGPISGLSGFKKVVCGDQYSLAIKDDSTLWGWGGILKNPIEDGASTNKYIPVKSQSLSGVIAVAASTSFSLALKSDGTVWSWGNNLYGQLGNGTTTSSAKPTLINGLSGVIGIAVGSGHSLALKADSTVWAWGRNTDGQLGDGTMIQRNVPTKVNGLTGVVAIAVGEFFSLVLKSDGTMWSWGDNSQGGLGDGTNVDKNVPIQVGGTQAKFIAIASRGAFTLAIKSDSTLWGWGDNTNGQLGDGTFISKKNPTQVTGMSGVVAISIGLNHSQCLKSDGTFWSWGHNRYGQLGDGTILDRAVPVRIASLSNLKSFSGGLDFSMAVKADGSIVSWGSDTQGQTLNGRAYLGIVPARVKGLGAVIDVACGDKFSVAVKSDNTVWSWGDNSLYRLGHAIVPFRSAPAMVSGISNVVAVDAGTNHSLALKSDGTVWAWGYNGYGQLGDGTVSAKSAPVSTTVLTNVIAISCGGSHSLALKKDGTVWSWGYNSFFQLGDGTTTNKDTPAMISNLSGVVAIAGGEYFSVVLKGDGTVWAWGNNASGQLGDGTTINRGIPAQVSGLSGVVAIAAGGKHAIALKEDGSIWAWGSDVFGQLATGTNSSKNIPTQITSLKDVVSIVSGRDHTMALKGDGTIWAWGLNDYGQLGDGTTTNRNLPVQINATSQNLSTALFADFKTTVIGNTVGFNATPAIGSYYWSFGDGEVANAKTVQHIYAAAGIYKACLTYSNNGCQATNCTDVEVGTGNCRSAFDYKAMGDTLKFNENALGNPVRWFWEFGDGTNAILRNPFHIYSNGGIYNVCLTTKSLNGCIDQVCKDIVVKTTVSDCQSSFEVFEQNKVATFKNLSLGTATNYFWDFGDGNYSTEKDPSHTYALEGFYMVNLTMYNTITGCFNTDIRNVVIGGAAINLCKSDFIHQSNDSLLTVAFRDRSLGKPVSWKWNFSDGGTSTERHPIYKFSGPGFHRACLTVTSATGNKDIYCDVVGIAQIGLSASFIHKENDVYFFKNQASYPVSFYGSAYGKPSKWMWSFGDNMYDSLRINVVHNYQNPGSYNACLTISDPETKLVNTYCKYVKVGDVSGVRDNRADHGLSINPNPVSDVAIVSYALESITTVQLSLFDLQGKKLKSLVGENQVGLVNQVFDVTDLNLVNGMYILNLTVGGRTISKPLIIRRN